MSTSSEIKQRASALAEKTDVNSITPKEVGGIMFDLASHSENVLRNSGTLGIRKVYKSVAAMEADATEPVDLWGEPIKKGNLVVIYDGTDNGVDNNKIYAFMKPGWELATKLDAAYATKSEMDAKLSELASEVRCIKNEAREEGIASNESLTEMLILQNGKEYSYSKSWCTVLIPYSNKNKYHYHGYLGNYNLNPVAYYDNSGNIIGVMESSQGFIDAEIVDIPKGTAYLRFCAIADSKFNVSALSYYTVLKDEINEVRNGLNNQLLQIQGMSKDVPGNELKYTETFNILITSTSGHETPYDRAIASDYIEVVGGEKYYVSASMAFGYALCAFYDDTKKFISAIASENNNTPTIIENSLVTVPENAKYIRVTQIYSNPLGRVNEINTVPKIEDKWSSKKWVCVGDSLTEKNIRATKNYHDYIAEKTGIDVVNFGMSGTGYKRTEENGTAFYQRVSSIPADADVVTIFGSGNDLAHISVLGTATDSGTDTIGGCINTTINNIFAKTPLIALGIISPTPWIGNSPSNTANGMSKYSELLKEICKLRGIPFLDLFHCSNLRPDDEEFRRIAYSRDDGNGVHPDENGHKLIAPRFESFLGTLIL